MDERAAFILWRVADDLEVLAGVGVMPGQVGERLLVEFEVKRHLCAHLQGIGWAYESAEHQDHTPTQTPYRPYRRRQNGEEV